MHGSRIKPVNMPASFKIETQAVLPVNISREQIIAHIQKHETIIRMQPNVDHFEQLPSDCIKAHHILEDSFFTQLDSGGDPDIVTYEIHERLPIIPFLGISTVIKFPAHYQNFTTGVRVRADAPGGTIVRVTYVVRPLERSGLGAELRRGAWRLVEESQVECSAFVKPFVIKTYQGAHTNISQRIVDGLGAEILEDNSSP